MKKRIFSSIFTIALLCTVVSLFCIVGSIYNQRINQTRQAVISETHYIQAGLSISPKEYLNELMAFPPNFTDNRITLINEFGTVLFDTDFNPADMENHLSRPEVRLALKNGSGESLRISESTNEQIFYYAVRLADSNNILRVSKQTQNIFTYTKIFAPTAIFITLITALLSLAAAIQQTNRIVAPINELNLDLEFHSCDAYDELSPLLNKIEKQNREISSHIQQLSRKQEELAYITENMREGLIVISHENHILSVNNSAVKYLDLNRMGIIGKNISNINHYFDTGLMLEKIAKNSHDEQIFEKNGRTYRVSGNAVHSGGAALLIMDITDKLAAEQSRREFSANVSHELKTPLQVISGYAEIMRNGIAKSEDIPRFSEKIYEESTRMTKLIEDIIKLSRLDESVDMYFQTIELSKIAQKVILQLEPFAMQKRVSISSELEPCYINGVSHVIEEMFFNIIENAIKYNKLNGDVNILLKQDAKHITFKVSDNGIGINQNNLDRVFERFYREDTSHSKEIEGTGLGLSIVKHSAALHKAKLDLKSELGKGTVISIYFPYI